MKRDIDLVPQAYRQAHAMRRQLMRWARLAAVLVPVVAALGVPIRLRARGLAQSNAALRSVVNQKPALALELARTEAEIQNAYQQYKDFKMRSNEPDWNRLLGELSGMCDSDLWLRRLSIMPAGANGGTHNTVIEGEASADKRVIEFMEKLKHSSEFAHVELKGTVPAGDGATSKTVNFTMASEIR